MAFLRDEFKIPKGDTVQIVGPPRSGKTWYIGQILRNINYFIQDGATIQNVCVAYQKWQPIYSELKAEGLVHKWISGVPSATDFDTLVTPHKAGGSIVVFDDCLNDINADLLKIVTVLARHNNVTLFLLQQTLFPRSKYARDISLTLKFIFLFKTPRDTHQFSHLATQMAGKGSKWIVDAYHDVTDERYGCFIIDLRPECKENLRFRSHMLPTQVPMRVYMKKGAILSQNG